MIYIAVSFHELTTRSVFLDCEVALSQYLLPLAYTGPVQEYFGASATSDPAVLRYGGPVTSMEPISVTAFTSIVSQAASK